MKQERKEKRRKSCAITQATSVVLAVVFNSNGEEKTKRTREREDKREETENAEGWDNGIKREVSMKTGGKQKGRGQYPHNALPVLDCRMHGWRLVAGPYLHYFVHWHCTQHTHSTCIGLLTGGPGLATLRVVTLSLISCSLFILFYNGPGPNFLSPFCLLTSKYGFLGHL